MQQFEKHIIKPNQTLADLAIQHYGQIDYLFAIMQDNAELKSIDAAITAGKSVNIRQNFGNKAIVTAINDAKAVIATGDGTTTLEGIGYWGVEENFIIS